MNETEETELQEIRGYMRAAAAQLLQAYRTYLATDKYVPRSRALRDEIELHATVIASFSSTLGALSKETT